MSNTTEQEIEKFEKALFALRLEVDSSIAESLLTLFAPIKAALQKVSDVSLEVGENEYLDLTVLNENDKAEFIKQVAGSCAKELLKTFLGFGLNNFIEIMVTNDTDKKEYILTFQTKEQFMKRFVNERKDNVGVNDAIEFADWFRQSKYVVNSMAEWFSYDTSDKPTTEQLYKIFRESQPQQKEVEESEKELEERTDRNMNLISDFVEHLESENIVIPESAILSFFNA